LLSQKEEHAKEAMEELKKYGDASRVEWIQLDLKDLKRTDEVAKTLANEQQIDGVSWHA
jgi:WW domain-containing oxidoreductase